jgi:hypothetical protein
MKKAVALILMTLLTLALLLFTASRTLRLVESTLPADSQTMGYLALAAIDGGLLIWPAVYLYGARGMWQRGISVLMIVVSLIGVAIAVVADTFLQAGRNGVTAKINPDQMTASIWIVTAIILLNVTAGVLMHITSPENLEAQEDEETHSRIHRAQMRARKEKAAQLEAEISGPLAEDWRAKHYQQYMAQMTYYQPPQLPVPPYQPYQGAFQPGFTPAPLPVNQGQQPGQGQPTIWTENAIAFQPVTPFQSQSRNGHAADGSQDS